jgi:hypothetical protein
MQEILASTARRLVVVVGVRRGARRGLWSMAPRREAEEAMDDRTVERSAFVIRKDRRKDGAPLVLLERKMLSGTGLSIPSISLLDIRIMKTDSFLATIRAYVVSLSWASLFN